MKKASPTGGAFFCWCARSRSVRVERVAQIAQKPRDHVQFRIRVRLRSTAHRAKTLAEEAAAKLSERDRQGFLARRDLKRIVG